MGRLTWLADELRKAGLKVVEVDGWKTRGSTEFDPIGVTWHATAGSRTSTARGEVNVILHGSTGAVAQALNTGSAGVRFTVRYLGLAA